MSSTEKGPYAAVRGSSGSEDGSQIGSGGGSDRGLDDTEQGLEPMGVATTSSSSFPAAAAASAARRCDRRALRALAIGVGVVLFAGAGILAVLVGSTGVPEPTRAKVRAFVPFMDKHWRYINSCPGVITVDDYGPAGGAADKKRAEPVQLVFDNRPHFTLFGDSITEMSYDPERMGFSALLANAYNRFADIRDRGFSGYSTRDSVRALDLVFPPNGRSLARALPPALVFVFLGANDAVAPGAWIRLDGEDHHVPLDEYKANLKTIIAHLRTLHAAQRIILITPPPVDDARKAPERLNARAREYADAMIQVGAEARVPTFDLWKALHGDKPEVAATHLIDGLHLNAAGNQVVYDGIIRMISTHFPGLMPGMKDMPKQVPDPW